ncbi:MAG: TusE/DsrC/DsvC family sulfur relay protein [Owenweeksia sp.]|nr:TusE/DsrC/DsvC family sulfur relay protein [Owenweeksia sp.]
MEKQINGHKVIVNEQGYLTDLNQWNREIAEEIAREEGIALEDEHWQVLDYLQDQHRKEVPLTIRKVGKSGVVDIKGFYALFPGGPLKKASRIAGIPKPASCI